MCKKQNIFVYYDISTVNFQNNFILFIKRLPYFFLPSIITILRNKRNGNISVKILFLHKVTILDMEIKLKTLHLSRESPNCHCEIKWIFFFVVYRYLRDKVLKYSWNIGIYKLFVARYELHGFIVNVEPKPNRILILHKYLILLLERKDENTKKNL